MRDFVGKVILIILAWLFLAYVILIQIYHVDVKPHTHWVSKDPYLRDTIYILDIQDGYVQILTPYKTIESYSVSLLKESYREIDGK